MSNEYETTKLILFAHVRIILDSSDPTVLLLSSITYIFFTFLLLSFLSFLFFLLFVFIINCHLAQLKLIALEVPEDK